MVYVDGIRIKVGDQGVVTVTVAYLVMGIDVEGRTHALGIWIAEAEGATLWLSVLTEVRHRGLRDILICCGDGLTGLPEAITTVFPNTVVQTCVVHYPDIVVMPMPGRKALVGGGARAGDIGITGLLVA
jgi:transposase-like protein